MKETFQKFIERAVQKISSDNRFCGLAVGGSWISDEIDEYSDLDLVVVCLNDKFHEIMNARFEFVKSLGPHISSFTGDHVGEPRLVICLFNDPLMHVDIKFAALKDFEKRIENPRIAWERDGLLSNILEKSLPQMLKPDCQWIEDRFWTWVHYCALKIARGEFFEAIGFLTFLRETTVTPMALYLKQKPPRRTRRVEQYLPDFAKRLEATIPSYDKKSCVDALYATIEIYKDLRENYPNVKLNAEVERLVLNYVDGLQLGN